MLQIRSLAFNLAFYASLIVQMIVFTPIYFILPRHLAWFVPRNWSHSSMWLMKVIAGTDRKIEGLENLPEGGYILAPKHQSFWDTIAFFPYMPDPVYILKRELMWIPLFGWYVGKMKMIPIHRGSRSKALKQAVKVARERMADGRQLIIYP
jgi:1-acyl-sn-glycerol-3-phosphate acyltransferase